MKMFFAEGFAQYVNAADMAQSWKFGAAPVLVKTENLYEFRGASGQARAVITHAIAPSQRAGVGVDLRITAASSNASIALSPAGYADRNRGTSGQSPKGIYVAVIDGTPRLYYDILTSATGYAVNSLLLAELEPLALGAHHVELIVDVSDAVAQARVFINGVLAADEIFDRDRLQNGFQATEIGEVSFQSAATTAANAPWISNIISYDPQAPDSAPIGPVDVTYLAADDAALSIGPAVDTTGVTINDLAWRDFEMSDVDAEAQIISASLIYRLAGVAGQNPTAAEVAMESDGVQIGGTARHEITPGYAAKLHEMPIPVATSTIINNITLKIRSDGEP